MCILESKPKMEIKNQKCTPQIRKLMVPDRKRRDQNLNHWNQNTIKQMKRKSTSTIFDAQIRIGIWIPTPTRSLQKTMKKF